MTAPTIVGSKEAGPVFFWREFETPYGYLSQWYECAFEHEGITYLHAEMWMMIQKAKLFGDEETVKKMLEATIPAEHQKLGRQVKGYDGEKWNANKSRIVEEGNWWKFTSSKEQVQMKKMLLETGDRELVEASPTDRIWGVGYGAADAEANRQDWGQNLLGHAITRVREKLQRESRI